MAVVTTRQMLENGQAAKALEVYAKCNAELPEVLAGLGTSILTTSRGVMTGREAIKVGVGGEVLCNIW